ncbi:sugar ABC transporter permease [Gracilibacillus boraciitolerans JCM 21714]|uniref:Sugar ABC transporter permease n=1 Tax=Gracilibacillus boraciitolerans JCM 21714 TaxID=1298598 RepID=W4VPF7_9BACI|nr:sugar ABC transporter permease [Gracilibacillus boraciitolerans]GAE95265.1 sugar ABC transporter permease [Gracilibacillus boraciitolerans JCM 21714]
MNGSRKKFFQHDNIGYLFVLPALIFMVALIGYPIISNFILSFQDVTAMTMNAANKDFVGFDNYIKLLNDEVLIKSIFNTILFTVACIIVQFVIGFALALFFNKKFTFAKPIRGLMMVSWMVPITITALMYKFMFSTNVGGVINYMLQSLHIIDAPIDWLTSPVSAFVALVIANIWIGIPFNMILLSTGLTTLPKDVYESSSIDGGANKIQQFFKITLPMLRPTIEAVLILGLIYTFKVFDLVYVMTKGGPSNSTQVLSTYSYKLSFDLFKFSEGATVANILFIILFVVSLLYITGTRKGGCLRWKTQKYYTIKAKPAQIE